MFLSDTQRQILHALQKEPLDQFQLAADTALSPAIVRDELRALTRMRLVRSRIGARSIVWRLTSRGEILAPDDAAAPPGLAAPSEPPAGSGEDAARLSSRVHELAALFQDDGAEQRAFTLAALRLVVDILEGISQASRFGGSAHTAIQHLNPELAAFIGSGRSELAPRRVSRLTAPEGHS